MSGQPRFKRVLLKISGESFAKPGEVGIDAQELRNIASEIGSALETGVHLAVVVGGGNMIRGANLAKQLEIDQSTADYMGMLGTVMNGMASANMVTKGAMASHFSPNSVSTSGPAVTAMPR